jgi:hypothetical protein
MSDIASGNGMAKVNDPGVRIYRQNHAVHGSGKTIANTKIGGKCDDRVQRVPMGIREISENISTKLQKIKGKSGQRKYIRQIFCLLLGY